MKKILRQSFFERATPVVARELLGTYLVRKIAGETRRYLVTEVEAYDGFKDRASHASRGQTPRNEVMFGQAGRFYVYFVYGKYWMLNIVTRRRGYPAAILIRGAGEFRGPGKLTRALEITSDFNGLPAQRESGLWFEEDTSSVLTPKNILTTPRVGVAYAGTPWIQKKWRFVLKQ